MSEQYPPTTAHEKHPEANIAFEFQVCLAEYNAVREEIRARAEAHRRVTEYGVLTLGGIAGILALLQTRGISQPAQSVAPFPIHYLFLLIPLLFLYLQSVYIDESYAEYVAQAYVTHILKPNMEQILRRANEPERLTLKNIWDWDDFHITSREKIAVSKFLGPNRYLLTVLLPILAPISFFLMGAQRYRGCLTVWDCGLAGLFILLLVANGVAFLRLRDGIESYAGEFAKR